MGGMEYTDYNGATRWLEEPAQLIDIQVDGVPYRVVGKWAGKWLAVRKQDARQVILDSLPDSAK